MHISEEIRNSAARHWSHEPVQIKGILNGEISERAVDAFVHKDRGIAFAVAFPNCENATPNDRFLCQIFHIPSKTRLFSVLGTLDEAISIALLVANIAPWHEVENPITIVEEDFCVRMALLTLLKGKFTMVSAGSNAEKHIYEHLSTMVVASMPAAGNA